MRDLAYAVMWKRQDEWVRVFESDFYSNALKYAQTKISLGHITQAIEIRSQSRDGRLADTHYVNNVELRRGFENSRK